MKNKYKAVEDNRLLFNKTKPSQPVTIQDVVYTTALPFASSI